MRKTLLIAKREYRAAVRTKGFIIGLLLAPVLMGGSSIAFALLKDKVDTTDRKVVIIDHSGLLADALVQAAKVRNDTEIFDKETGKKSKPAYRMEIVQPRPGDLDAQRLELSDRIRGGQLQGFVIIGRDVLHPGEDRETSRIAYHSKNAAMDPVRSWMTGPINNHLRQLRLAEAGVDESALDEVLAWAPVDGLGLVTVDPETGAVQEARKSSKGEALVAPLILLMLMFLMIMMGAVPQLNSVMEEKTLRIAEVLLGSIKPFDFMMGKVLGGVSVTLTASSVYVVIGIVALQYMDLMQYVPFHVLPWFFAFMLSAIVMLGAIYSALGATCNDTKDAQNLMFPGMIPVMIPMFVIMPVLLEPLTGFATYMSLFPLFAPILMVLRLASPYDIPAWQPWLALLGVLLCTALAIWAGGRIFRVAILMQGTPPNVSRILRWAIKG